MWDQRSNVGSVKTPTMRHWNEQHNNGHANRNASLKWTIIKFVFKKSLSSKNRANLFMRRPTLLQSTASPSSLTWLYYLHLLNSNNKAVHGTKIKALKCNFINGRINNLLREVVFYEQSRVEQYIIHRIKRTNGLYTVQQFLAEKSISQR